MYISENYSKNKSEKMKKQNNHNVSTTDRIIQDTGRATEVLYGLDIFLSNSYRGDGGEHDRALNQIRAQVNKAMKAIGGPKIFPKFKNLK